MPARGSVSVPADADLSLKLDYVFTVHPELLVVPPCRLVQIVGDTIGFEDSICKPISLIPTVQRIELSSSDITDSGVVQLCTMKKLRAVAINKTLIEGGCLHALGQLPILYLDISQNNIKPAYYKDFALFKKVVRARFAGDNLNDEALKYIAQMTDLQDLLIRANHRITIEGLKYLVQLKHLNYLSIRDTKLSVLDIEFLLEHTKLKGLVADDRTLDNPTGVRLRKKYAKILNSYTGTDMNEVKTLYAPLK